MTMKQPCHGLFDQTARQTSMVTERSTVRFITTHQGTVPHRIAENGKDDALLYTLDALF